jgi:hypothetical protein
MLGALPQERGKTLGAARWDRQRAADSGIECVDQSASM